jgi:hypothetical protein
MNVDFSDLLVLVLALLNLVQAIVFAAFAFASKKNDQTPPE